LTCSALTTFQSSVFEQGADFLNCIFRKNGNFADCIFKGRLRFFGKENNFKDNVTFLRSRFNGETSFDLVTFDKSVDFDQTKFDDFASFQEVKFGVGSSRSEIKFSKCDFKKPADFRNAVFASGYPTLVGSVIHERSSFSATPEAWPVDRPTDLGQARDSCASIRHAVSKQGLPEAEHFFFRREMGFAGQSGPWWQRPPYWLFGWLSDYGYGILTPLLWLCLLIVGGASVLAWGAAESAPSLDFWQGLGLSFSNAFNFLGFHKTFQTEDLMGKLPPLMKAFSGFQTIGGVILLFFVGLGLRTRFRLR
jgi:hypothetical protein